MSELRLSVVVVSRHRPEALLLCLASLAQQDYAATEVIVVADPAGFRAARASGLVSRVVEFDEPNISRARNIGMALAAGDVVAFIDDDAVAEPTWASRLVAPFLIPDVIASTGFVRGRNGISYQWQAYEVDESGVDHRLEIPEGESVILTGSNGRAIKTVGTNCAFRLATLREIGGFDEAFHFFLDETDVNLRLRGRGRTAIVPMAQVAHGYLASGQRAHNRVPLTLFDIGASTAAFALRHQPKEVGSIWARLRREQRRRLLQYILKAKLSPFRAAHLLKTLVQGWREGLTRQPATLSAKVESSDALFQPLLNLGPRPGYFVCGWERDLSNLLDLAAAKARDGHIVTVLCLSKSFKRHKHAFDIKGFWLQTGGVWGKADRSAVLPFGASSDERELLVRRWCSKRRNC